MRELAEKAAGLLQGDEASFEVLLEKDALVVLGPFCALLCRLDLDRGAVGNRGKQVEEGADWREQESACGCVVCEGSKGAD